MGGGGERVAQAKFHKNCLSLVLEAIVKINLWLGVVLSVSSRSFRKQAFT